MVPVFEMLLCYWAWLKKDEYWHCNDGNALQIAKNAIWVLINRLKTLFPCTKGSQWNIPKIHKQLHIADNIQLYGAHRNIHTGPQEHNHIENAKRPSERTQKRKAVFDLQIANQLVDRYIIDYTHLKILNQQAYMSKYEETGTLIVQDESTQYAAKFDVFIVLNQMGNIDLEYQWVTLSQKDKSLDENLLKCIAKLFFKTQSKEKQKQGVQVRGFTEYTRQGVTFRCHPNYKSEGAWYDYALFAWDQPCNAKYSKSKSKGVIDWNKEILDEPVVTEDTNKTSNVLLIPGKILCFVKDQNDEMFAIIHSCLDNYAKMSVLTYRWQLEYEEDKPMSRNVLPHECSIDASNLTPVYHAVSVDTLQKHCLMIPYQGMDKSHFLMQIIDQDKWWESFTTV